MFRSLQEVIHSEITENTCKTMDIADSHWIKTTEVVGVYLRKTDPPEQGLRFTVHYLLIILTLIYITIIYFIFINS